MLKSLIAFCLSRRAIIVFGVIAFAGAGALCRRDGAILYNAD